MPYLDGGGVWTVGYGDTADVTTGQMITQAEAEDRLKHDVEECDAELNGALKRSINQHQYDSLISILYNVGPGKKGKHDGLITLKSGEPSTLLRMVNEGNFDGAGYQFRRWNKDNGQVVDGLTRRRLAEERLFRAK